MKKFTLENINIGKKWYEKLRTIIDDDGVIVLLPLIYAAHTDTQGEIYKVNCYSENWATIKKIETATISKKTAGTYFDCLYKFIKYINTQHQLVPNQRPSIHELYACDTKDINEYLNEVLPNSLSVSSLETHCAAISTFYALLASLNICKYPDISVTREAREIAARNDRNGHKILYISSRTRFEMLNACNNKRDRAVLRLGGEAGLRTAELRGMILGKYNRNGEFLLDVFRKLESKEYENENEFSYTLLGKYTKNGVTRTLYLKRELATTLLDYYRTERSDLLNSLPSIIEPDELLLRMDNRGKTKPIGERQGSNIFSKIRKELGTFKNDIGFHALRHSFATEQYHENLLDMQGKETRSESAALLNVATRLGHAIGKDGKPRAVTIRYIRMREQMLEIENGAYHAA